jgi:two-component system response regulator RegA
MAGMNVYRNVLIVDPDPVHCHMLGRALAQRNYEVFVSHDGESALGIAGAGALGHAVVELDLPDRSGLKLVERLKASNGRLKIVVLASHPSIATAVEAIKLGATHYLPKPALPEEVIAAFERDNGNADVAIHARPLSLEAFIWERIDRALVENGGNVSAAARALDMHRRTLQRKLRQRSRRTNRTLPMPARVALGEGVRLAESA